MIAQHGEYTICHWNGTFKCGVFYMIFILFYMIFLKNQFLKQMFKRRILYSQTCQESWRSRLGNWPQKERKKKKKARQSELHDIHTIELAWRTSAALRLRLCATVCLEFSSITLWMVPWVTLSLEEECCAIVKIWIPLWSSILASVSQSPNGAHLTSWVSIQVPTFLLKGVGKSIRLFSAHIGRGRS